MVGREDEQALIATGVLNQQLFFTTPARYSQASLLSNPRAHHASLGHSEALIPSATLEV